VRNFVQAAGVARAPGAEADPASDGVGLSSHTRIVSIGPVTSATLREHGMPVDVEAERHDIDGLLQALLADAAAPER